MATKPRPASPAKPVSPQPAKKPGKSVADFRASHDKRFIVPKKIAEALKALGDGWEYEREFCALATVAYQDIARFREQFPDNIVTMRSATGNGPRYVWAGKAAIAAQLREMVSAT